MESIRLPRDTRRRWDDLTPYGRYDSQSYQSESVRKDVGSTPTLGDSLFIPFSLDNRSLISSIFSSISFHRALLCMFMLCHGWNDMEV
jgi:hypothetical protein